MKISDELKSDIMDVVIRLKSRLISLWKSGRAGKSIVIVSVVGVILVLRSCPSSCRRDREKEFFGPHANATFSGFFKHGGGEDNGAIPTRGEQPKRGNSDKLEFDLLGRLEGAFGYKLGDFYNDVANAKKMRGGGLLVEVFPREEKRVHWFDRYVLTLTPISHRIVEIVAGRSKLGPWHELDGDWEQALIGEMAYDCFLACGCELTKTEIGSGVWYHTMDDSSSMKNGVIMDLGWNYSSYWKNFGVRVGIRIGQLNLAPVLAQENDRLIAEKWDARPDALEEAQGLRGRNR